MDKRVTKCSKCAECEFLRCFDYAFKNYYCDNEDRTDDMGYVSVDNPSEKSPDWCPKREGEKS